MAILNRRRKATDKGDIGIMAFVRLNDLRLIKEYCIKPIDYECESYETCYNDAHQCRYFKQVFKRNYDDFYTIREGNKWYTTHEEN